MEDYNTARTPFGASPLRVITEEARERMWGHPYCVNAELLTLTPPKYVIACNYYEPYPNRRYFNSPMSGSDVFYAEWANWRRYYAETWEGSWSYAANDPRSAQALRDHMDDPVALYKDHRFLWASSIGYPPWAYGKDLYELRKNGNPDYLSLSVLIELTFYGFEARVRVVSHTGGELYRCPWADTRKMPSYLRSSYRPWVPSRRFSFIGFASLDHAYNVRFSFSKRHGECAIKRPLFFDTFLYDVHRVIASEYPRFCHKLLPGR